MQVKDPLLSVILPVYNAEKFIKQAITSILKQSFSDFELLVVDDGSTDGTLDLIKEISDPRIKVFKNKINLSKVNSCNSRVQECRGKYMTIHDADDYSAPDRFEKQVEFLEKNPEFAMCGTQFYEVDLNGKVLRKIVLETDPAKLKELVLIDSQFHGPTMIFKKNVLYEIGGLYRNFRNKEDVDLAMRIGEKYPVINLTDYLYYYRLVPQGLSKHNFGFFKFEGMKVLQALSQQRKETGTDCLMTNDEISYNAILNKINQPYRDDPSLLFRKAISLSVYFKFWKNAFYYAFKAIHASPLKAINYKELLYVIKVWLKQLSIRANG